MTPSAPEGRAGTHPAAEKGALSDAILIAERRLSCSESIREDITQAARIELARLRDVEKLAGEAATAARSRQHGEIDPETGARYPMDWTDWLRRYEQASGGRTA